MEIPKFARSGHSSNAAPALTSSDVWDAVSGASYAVLSFVTPSGKPRASGVMYTLADRKLFLVTAANSLKARLISDGDQVAVTIPIRRGGVLSLVAPIPPATIGFHATATVHPPGALDIADVSERFAKLLPEERRNGCVIELLPSGDFLTYGLGVSLRDMARPERSIARTPVS